MCDNILEKNNESQKAVIQAYQTTLNLLAQRCKAEDISSEEWQSNINTMISVADKIAQVDLQNKKFLLRMGNELMFFLLMIAGGVFAGLGINSALSKGNLPQVSETKSETLT